MRIPFFSLSTLLACALVTDALPDAMAAPDTRYLEFMRALPISPVKNIILEKRQQGSCQANHISCASLQAPDACCPNGTTCGRDGSGKIACCPNNFVCTGVVGGSGPSPTQSSGGTTGIPPTSSITPAPTPGAAITAGSTVQNNYYPFQYIVTTYSNANDCLAAFSFCQQQSSSCYASLAGQNGVTVSNGLGGGGVTQAGASGAMQGGASSICSSLSVTACYALQSSQCAQFGNGGGASSVQQGHGPRETGCAGAKYMAALGFVGAVGLAV